MTELNKLVSEITKLNIQKAVFSVPYKKDADVIKCILRPTDGGSKFQFESFTKTQAFHKNVTGNDVKNQICALVENDFRQAEIFTDAYVYGIKISSKGKVLHNKRKNTFEKSSTSNHNREKNHIIDLENAPPVFTDIGIVGKDGSIVNSKYDKYKQICRFVEFIDDIVRKDPRDEYNIIDFGCGKSYLTFVCYYYMTKIAHKKVNIVGLDLKEKVIEDCNCLAQKYGYTNLKFLCMDIKDYLPSVRPDMVIALHACDVATDYALYNAYRWQADYIFCVPCCQHELNAVIKSESFGILCDYGLIKERFSALATDLLRAKYLELCGYNVDVLEFIDIEHSPKNLLIRAKRSTRISDKKKAVLKKKISRFEDEYNSNLCFGKLIMQRSKTFHLDGNDYLAVAGKSSMLLKDALSVRAEVFGNELNFKSGARRDELDDTSWFVNIYDGDGMVVSTSRMAYTSSNDERFLGKICVLANVRGLGFGREMLSILEEIARDEGAKVLNINSRQTALEFYSALGYSVSGREFMQENIKMIPVSKKI